MHFFNLPIRAFQHDSRQVEPGDLFFALKGARSDGHHYLNDVAQKGAIGAVIQEDFFPRPDHLFCVPVQDVQETLQAMAAEAFSKASLQAIGVTGSVGKTTTKEFIATLIQGSKTPASCNSQVGLPLSILNEIEGSDFFVMEMGMSQPGELTRLVQMAPPDIAMITQIALAHAANFPDGLNGIAAAKAEIFSHARTKLGVIHTQVAKFKPVMGCDQITYGGDDGDYRIEKRGKEYQVYEGSTISPRFFLPFEASHLVENALGALAVARQMGFSWEELLPRCMQLQTCSHRFAWEDKKGIRFLNDSYNANPASMKAAFKHLQEVSRSGRLIAVLGSMRELGSFEAMAHREVGEMAVDIVDALLCIGNECGPLVDCFIEKGKPVEWLDSLDGLSGLLAEWALPGDVVLLKGSNSHQLWKLLQ